MYVIKLFQEFWFYLNFLIHRLHLRIDVESCGFLYCSKAPAVRLERSSCCEEERRAKKRECKTDEVAQIIPALVFQYKTAIWLNFNFELSFFIDGNLFCKSISSIIIIDNFNIFFRKHWKLNF